MIFAGALFALAAAACLPVGGDAIRAKDLAKASPGFAALPPETILAPAPEPGITRTLPASELSRMLARFGAGGQVQEDVCVERSGALITRETALAAMRKALAGWNAEIEILDLPSNPYPDGALEFPLSGLLQPKEDGSAIWRGWLKTAGGRRYAAPVRVKVVVDRVQLVALEELPAGQPIQPGQLRERRMRSHSVPGRQELTLDRAVGRIPRRSIPAGAVLTASLLDAPRVVRAGQAVEIEVRTGPILLKLPGTAAADARLGETVKVKSSMNGEVLLARVEGPTCVVVEPSGKAPGLRRVTSGKR